MNNLALLGRRTQQLESNGFRWTPMTRFIAYRSTLRRLTNNNMTNPVV